MSNYNVEISADNTITVGLPSTGNGVAGPRGEKGYSAYEVAVKNGYTGTEAEWLATLKGEKGEKGEPGDKGETGPAGTNGKDGANGTDGKPGTNGLSAYELAVQSGFIGNKEAWLESLKGDKGDTGDSGADGKNGVNGLDGKDGLSAYAIAVKNGYNGTEEEWVNKWLRGTIISAVTAGDGTMTMTDINGNQVRTSLQPVVDAAVKASAENAKAAERYATFSENSAKSASLSSSAANSSETHAAASETNSASYLAQSQAYASECKAAVEKISGAMKYAGSVDNYSDLPVTNNNPGDTYNVKNADAEHGVNAGDNVAWNGIGWDNLAGTVDLSIYATNDGVAATFNNVTYSNDTINFIRKNGETTSVTVNNVVHAVTADSATTDAAGNNIASTYVTQNALTEQVNQIGAIVTEIMAQKLNTNATAVKAEADANGNDIAATYSTKAETTALSNAIADTYATKEALTDLQSSTVAKTALWEALHSQDSTTLTGLTNAQWSALGVFIRYFTTLNNFENQPSQYGQLINLTADKNNEVAQLWLTQPDGILYYRGGNGNTAVKDKTFTRVANYNADGHLVFPNGAELWVY